MTPGRSVARKLDADKVRQMRQLRREGSTLKQIASRFDVSVPLVSRIVRAKPKHWAHVVDVEPSRNTTHTRTTE